MFATAWFATHMRVNTPLGRLPWWAVVAGNAAFWPAWTAAVGYSAHRAPADWFAADDFLTRGRPAEHDGAWYRDRLRIERWKDHMPEAGAAFPGGFAKRGVGVRDPETLRAFTVETRRAEYAHWAMAAGVVITIAWNPWWAAPVNVSVAAGSNLPCIAIQRYNRARLLRILRRSTSERDAVR